MKKVIAVINQKGGTNRNIAAVWGNNTTFKDIPKLAYAAIRKIRSISLESSEVMAAMFLLVQLERVRLLPDPFSCCEPVELFALVFFYSGFRPEELFVTVG